jgi:hypothetical protein
MFCWVSGSLLALLTAPLISAGPVPTTQSAMRIDLGKLNDLQRQLDTVQAQLNAAKAQLDALSKLPPIQPWQFQGVPPVPGQQGPIVVKPYGRSFEFNGLTVYVEPISQTEKQR